MPTKPFKEKEFLEDKVNIKSEKEAQKEKEREGRHLERDSKDG